MKNLRDHNRWSKVMLSILPLIAIFYFDISQANNINYSTVPPVLSLGMSNIGAIVEHNNTAPLTLSQSQELQTCAKMTMRALGGLIKVGEARLELLDCQQAKAILGAIPKKLSITFYRSISAQRLNKAANDALLNHQGMHSDEENIFECVRDKYQKTEPGDIYEVIYMPGSGLTLKLNQVTLAQCTDNEQLPAYFNIWFGEKPFHRDLRDELLSQSLAVPVDPASETRNGS